jgi:uncharacterized protein YecT (DUF1311 family)
MMTVFRHGVRTAIACGFLAAASSIALGQQPPDRSGFAQFLVNPGQIDERYSKAFSDCMRSSGGVTVAMRDCSSTEYKRLDTVLNQTFQAALDRLGSEPKKAALRQYQREWLVFRENHCRDAMAMIRRIMWLETYQG